MEQDYGEGRFPGHGVLTGIREQCEGQSTLGGARASLCLQNSNLSCSVLKVKFFIYNSTLFFLNFGKSFRKGKHMRLRTVVIMFDSFWMTTESFMEWPSINFMSRFKKQKQPKDSAKQTKLQTANLTCLFFFLFLTFGLSLLFMPDERSLVRYLFFFLPSFPFFLQLLDISTRWNNIGNTVTG